LRFSIGAETSPAADDSVGGGANVSFDASIGESRRSALVHTLAFSFGGVAPVAAGPVIGAFLNSGRSSAAALGVVLAALVI
jgi:hypothetical protein